MTIQELFVSQRDAAYEAGKKLNDARTGGRTKMRTINFLERQHHQAWQRVYATEAVMRHMEIICDNAK